MKSFNKVAVLNDIVCLNGGAEFVLDIFLEMFSNCDLYTIFMVPGRRRLIEKRFPNVRIHVSVFQNLIKTDKVPKHISVIKVVSWIYWKILDLKPYDLIISSSHSYGSKNVNKNVRGLHVSYIHTPPRYLYKEFNEIGFIRKFPLSLLFWPIKFALQKIDKKGSQYPDLLIANSKNVQNRIKKYYGRKSVVLYPPVKMLNPKQITKDDYFLCLSRLVKQKGIDLAIKVCNRYNLPLVVVGDGSEFNNLVKIAGKNVRFKRNCSDIEKANLIRRSRALIYLSIEEDFGIVPIEVMSTGTPVIAFNSGGVKETVKNNLTGILFNNYSENGLKKAINAFEKTSFDSKICIANARKFRIETFKKNFLRLLETI